MEKERRSFSLRLTKRSCLIIVCLTNRTSLVNRETMDGLNASLPANQELSLGVFGPAIEYLK